MVDSEAMAVFHGIKNLKEGIPNEWIIVHVLTPLGDIREHVSVWTEVQYNIGAIRFVHNLPHGHYIGVRTGCIVKRDLARLERLLSAVQYSSIGVGFAEGLDCVPDIGEKVECRIYDAIGASTQYPLQLQALP